MRTSRSCRHITRFWGVFCGSIFPGTIQLRLRLHSSCGPPPATLFRPASTPPSRGPRGVANRRPGSGGQAPVVSSAGNKSAAPTGQTIRLEQAPSRATNPPPSAGWRSQKLFGGGAPPNPFPRFPSCGAVVVVGRPHHHTAPREKNFLRHSLGWGMCWMRCNRGENIKMMPPFLAIGRK